MLFSAPPVTAGEAAALDRIEALRAELRRYTTEPRRWIGLLRRSASARAIQSSNSIEGYNVSDDDAVAAVEGDEPTDASGETWQAILGYRNAMTYVLQLARDPHFRLDVNLVRSLHFMMTGHDLRVSPGQWRPGSVYVRNEATGEVVHEGPEAEAVPELMAELLDVLGAEPGDRPALLRAAMAHLNLVMIHPFRDGNGRMARCLQTLVLTRDGILSPEFCSIEEHLGSNTAAYYDVLAEVGGGRRQPHRDTRPWIRFVLRAHYLQAQTHRRRLQESERLWEALERRATGHGLPLRTVSALFDAAHGLRLRNASYRSSVRSGWGEAVTENVASRDLKLLVDHDLLEPHGEKRGRYYVAARDLRRFRDDTRLPRPGADGLFDAA